MTQPNNAGQGQNVSPINKTPEQRKAELSSALQNLGATMPAEQQAQAIPVDIVKIIDILKGSKVQVGDITVDEVPASENWKSAITKAGKAIYVCLDTFGLRDLVKIGNRTVCMKVSLVIK